MNYTGKIYLKNSKTARLANSRVRIVREDCPEEPCNYMDLVFEKADDEKSIPADTIMKWKTDSVDHEPFWFFTTVERCKKMISKDFLLDSLLSQKQLKANAELEQRLYRNWLNGEVYGYIVEDWNADLREWIFIESCYGFYGDKEILEGINEIYGIEDKIICIEEDLKYDLRYDSDDTEKSFN